MTWSLLYMPDPPCNGILKMATIPLTIIPTRYLANSKDAILKIEKSLQKLEFADINYTIN